MSQVPWGTVIVNVTAYLLMDLLVGRTVNPPHSGAQATTTLTTLGTGFLGGYSTFSTACVEKVRLLLAGRQGPALAHTILMAAATLGAIGLGLAAGAALCQNTTQPGPRLASTKISQATWLRVEYEGLVEVCGSEDTRRHLQDR